MKSWRNLASVFTIVCMAQYGLAADRSANRIRPYEKNPRYWQYKGTPVVLLAGSKDDNLFQLPDLKQHLDEIVSAGGNYIRNTMSDRHDKGFELYPFKRLPNGKYDLDQWNEEYWRRFQNMLKLTYERDIIVQIELWDRFDYSDHRSGSNWLNHPYNPKNNVNYTAQQSGLKTTYKNHPNRNEQPFFFTVPKDRNNQVVLKYQIGQVDKMLSYSLEYGHVLYCMDNETSGSPHWGAFWSNHIKQRAAEAGVEVHTTEMWDQWDAKGDHHKRTFDHPELYSFIDISQNNHSRGQRHWDNLWAVRNYIWKHPRPINTVKIYGADTGRFGNSRDGEERFWRNIFGGCAATRFHRPDSGLGLSDRAKKHIRSMRLLLSDLDIFRCTPDADSKLLSERGDNEAYLTYVPGKQYAVYFPNGGDVTLDLSKAPGRFAVRWLDIYQVRWTGQRDVKGGRHLKLARRGNGHWVCLLSRMKGHLNQNQ
ncbi:hypothetical protein MYX65_11940 [Acidobacteria bacterium AH-259-L09]|nr:hypothetical protein [Acidobacteria bacterium AH-259-L09]